MGSGAMQLSNRLGHAALVHARSLLLWLLAALGYAVGWLIGILVSIFLWFIASIIAGYRAARQ